eukprot:SAG31_NODE_5818_length_2310_cov_2.984622_2_plen_87_part_00
MTGRRRTLGNVHLGNVVVKAARCLVGCEAGTGLDGGGKIEGTCETSNSVAVRRPVAGVQAESLIGGCVGRLAVLGEVMLHARPALI